MTSWFLGLANGFAGLALLAACASVVARPTAIVTDVQGRATLLRGGQVHNIQVLTEIGDSELIETAADARLTLVHYWPGNEYRLRGPGRVRVGYGALEALFGPAPERYDSKADLRLRPTGLVQAGVQMRGLRPQVRLLHPVGARLLPGQPEFAWEPVEGANGYRLTVSSEIGATLFETTVSGTTLRLPVEVALRPGARFAWRVTATTPEGERSAIAGFTTAAQDMAEDARRLRPADQAPFAEQVTYALWLRQNGFQSEAQAAWRALARQRPDQALLTDLANGQ